MLFTPFEKQKSSQLQGPVRIPEVGATAKVQQLGKVWAC